MELIDKEVELIRNKAERAHKSGYNCSQSVLYALADHVGIDEELALKISSGFAGGLRSGEVCGAVSGAIMGIGLKYGYSDGAYKDKKKYYSIVKEFQKVFKEKNNTIVCRELLGIDLSIRNGEDIIRQNNLFVELCRVFIQDAAEAAYKIIKRDIEVDKILL